MWEVPSDGWVFHNLPESAQAELHRRLTRSWGVTFQNSMFEGTSESNLDSKTVRVIVGKTKYCYGKQAGL